MQVNLNFNTNELTFLTCADGKYLQFIEPFIYFARKSNPDCHIEFFVPDSYTPSTTHVNVTFNVLPNGRADTLRFIVEPTHKTKYTYITDIDILYTELVCPYHLIQMETEGHTFSNIQRTNRKDRLSGLHFVNTELWYRDTMQARKQANPNVQDENVLYNIVKQTYPHATLKQGTAYRPVHGIHCSLNRPDIRDGWELTGQKLIYFLEAIQDAPDFGEWFQNNVTQRLVEATQI